MGKFDLRNRIADYVEDQKPIPPALAQLRRIFGNDAVTEHRPGDDINRDSNEPVTTYFINADFIRPPENHNLGYPAISKAFATQVEKICAQAGIRHQNPGYHAVKGTKTLNCYVQINASDARKTTVIEKLEKVDAVLTRLNMLHATQWERAEDPVLGTVYKTKEEIANPRRAGYYVLSEITQKNFEDLIPKNPQKASLVIPASRIDMKSLDGLNELQSQVEFLNAMKSESPEQQPSR